MTIDPKDLRTLLVRLALVTFAVRAAPMFTADLSPTEAAWMFGLGSDGPSAEPALQLSRWWTQTCGGVAGLVRLPVLLAEVALPLLAVGYARVCGWGTLAGLMTGLALALSPLAMQAGHRLGLGATTAAILLWALTLLRGGLRDGHAPRVGASALLLALAALVTPPLLLAVPAGLYMAFRAVADDRLRRLAMAGWGAAAMVAGLLRWGLWASLLPAVDATTAAWAAPLASEPSGWAQAGVAAAAWQGWASASLVGPQGAWAHLSDLLVSPPLAVGGGAVLLLLALWGLARGLVQADPPPRREPPRSPIAPVDLADADDDVDSASGAAAADGWRTLGVALPTAPRALGPRDWMPAVLLVCGALGLLAWAGHGGVAHGVADAVQVARVGMALLTGAGLAALALPRAQAQRAHELASRRRTYWTLGLTAVAIFGVGAWHLLAQTRSVERMAARKVARFARESVAEAEAGQQGLGGFLAIGPRGWAVAAQLDPAGLSPQLRLATTDPGDAAAHAVELLKAKPPAIALVGDKAALGADERADPTSRAVLRTLDRTMRLHGLSEVTDSHRLLGNSSVLVYARDTAPADPRTVRPQLAPGVAP